MKPGDKVTTLTTAYFEGTYAQIPAGRTGYIFSVKPPKSPETFPEVVLAFVSKSMNDLKPEGSEHTIQQLYGPVCYSRGISSSYVQVVAAMNDHAFNFDDFVALYVADRATRVRSEEETREAREKVRALEREVATLQSRTSSLQGSITHYSAANDVLRKTVEGLTSKSKKKRKKK